MAYNMVQKKEIVVMKIKPKTTNVIATIEPRDFEGERKKKEKAATTIQARARGIRNRKRIREMKEREKAATTIQARARGIRNRKRVEKMMKERKEYLKVPEEKEKDMMTQERIDMNRKIENELKMIMSFGRIPWTKNRAERKRREHLKTLLKNPKNLTYNQVKAYGNGEGKRLLMQTLYIKGNEKEKEKMINNYVYNKIKDKTTKMPTEGEKRARAEAERKLVNNMNIATEYPGITRRLLQNIIKSSDKATMSKYKSGEFLEYIKSRNPAMIKGGAPSSATGKQYSIGENKRLFSILQAQYPLWKKVHPNANRYTKIIKNIYIYKPEGN